MKMTFSAIAMGMLLLSGFSCNKIRDAIFPGVEVELPAFQFSVPPIPIVVSNEVSLGTFSMAFNLDSIVRAKTGGAFGIGAVNSIKIKKMNIALLDGDANNNLSNFESTRFSFSSNTKTDAVEIIKINFADTPSYSITVEPENSPELIGYLSGSQINFNLSGKTRRTTQKALEFKVVVWLNAK